MMQGSPVVIIHSPFSCRSKPEPRFDPSEDIQPEADPMHVPGKTVVARASTMSKNLESRDVQPAAPSANQKPETTTDTSTSIIKRQHSYFKSLMMMEDALLLGDALSGGTRKRTSSSSVAPLQGIHDDVCTEQASTEGDSDSRRASDSVSHVPAADTRRVPPTFAPTPSSSSGSIADLWELEMLVEQQHQQLIARGLLPREGDVQSLTPQSSLYSWSEL